MLTAILQNKAIAKDIYDLRAAMETAPEPVPGQFVHIDCGGGLLLRRPLSLCGYDNGIARLVYAARGEGTRRLSRRRPGERLDMLGPLGRGFVMDSRPALLVGGGIGVPPLVFCADRAEGRVHAVLGFRNADAVCLTEAFASAEVLTDDGSAGAKGYPHEALRAHLQTGDWARVLACGPVPMLRAVAKVCAEHGVECQVSLEERMACGVGACLVCACGVNGDYKRVCADGPVFDAREVEWDA
ncbi:MAG: dihydroorotate dehydrogenase electron transfer subunit [Oscillospiraceae bacterium]|nr:dihydroorotate dehydrogenase electron transfer subunit [Oscillospiraceae bacterium]